MLPRRDEGATRFVVKDEPATGCVDNHVRALLIETPLVDVAGLERGTSTAIGATRGDLRAVAALPKEARGNSVPAGRVKTEGGFVTNNSASDASAGA
jgi:hypothetical protein